LVAKIASGLTISSDLLPHLELQREVLGDRLDHKIAAGELAVVRGAVDAPAHGVGVLLCGLALLDGARELLLDLGDPLGERGLVDLAQHDPIARLRRHLRDAVAHQSRSKHSNRLDLLRHWAPRRFFQWRGAYYAPGSFRRKRRLCRVNAVVLPGAPPAPAEAAARGRRPSGAGPAGPAPDPGGGQRDRLRHVRWTRSARRR